MQPYLKATVDAIDEGWLDPSEDLLYELVGDLDLDRQFLIVERLDAPNTEYYIQVRISDDLGHFDVEYREGGPNAHFAAVVSREDEDEAHRLVSDVLTGWSFELDGWRERLEWVRWAPSRCDCCGEPVVATDRIDVKMYLPDAARDAPGESRHEVTPSLLRVDGVGAFARCLLPVQLSGDMSLVLGAWMRIEDADLERAVAVWNDDAYADLVLHGTFANAIKPWQGMLGAPVKAVVRDVEEIPYVESSPHPLTHEVISTKWDRDYVLSYFGVALPVSFQERLGASWSVERTAGLAARVVKGTVQFAGPGRTVYIDQYTDDSGGSPAEFLARVLENAPQVPENQTLRTETGDEVRHAFWYKAAVGGHDRHEMYGYVVRQGAVLALACIHDEPGDHRWAMHVFKSVRYRGSA